MQIIAAYSETGGVGKTTSAVSLAQLHALAGARTVLVDLDPRGAATKWLRVEPVGEGLHIGAILADPSPDGWAEEMAAPTRWSENLRMIPSHRQAARRERDASVTEDRLARALDGLAADVVVLDLPNRQGGPITENALTAATDVVIAAHPDEDGLDGLDGALETVEHFPGVKMHGVIACGVHDTITPRTERRALAAFREADMLLGMIPERVVVREARAAGDWYGAYRRGHIVADAYSAVLDTMKEKNR